MKVVDAYLLNKLDIDHNKFFYEKPATYVPVEVDFEDADILSDKNVRAKKTKLQRMKENLAKTSKKRNISSSEEEDDELLQRRPYVD